MIQLKNSLFFSTLATFILTTGLMSCNTENGNQKESKIISMNEIMIDAPVAKKVKKDLTRSWRYSY